MVPGDQAVMPGGSSAVPGGGPPEVRFLIPSIVGDVYLFSVSYLPCDKKDVNRHVNSGGGTVFFFRCRYPACQAVSSFVFSSALCAVHGTCILKFLCECMRALFLWTWMRTSLFNCLVSSPRTVTVRFVFVVVVW